MSLRITPVFAFVASKESRRPSSVAFESHMVSPETTGLDHALPGMGCFPADVSGFTPLDGQV